MSKWLCMRLRSSATGLAYVTEFTFLCLNCNSMPLGMPLLNVIHLAISYIHLACVVDCIKVLRFK